MLAPLAMVETLTSRYPAALADATEGLRLPRRPDSSTLPRICAASWL